jgi:hypothetical protein
MERVFGHDFDVVYEGEGFYRVFKHPEDRVGVTIASGWQGAIKEVAAWAWNEALREGETHD